MTKAFDPNDRAAILAALDDPAATNPIVHAVGTRLQTLMGAVKQAASQGGLPDQIEIAKPRTALDEIAVDLFKRALADMPGAPPVVVHEYGRQ